MHNSYNLQYSYLTQWQVLQKNILPGIADKKEVFHKALQNVNESINKLALVPANL